MDIQWEEPPEYVNVLGTGRQAGRYLRFALTLREHPGRWAVLPGEVRRTPKGATATAQNIRRGKVKGFKAGQYDTAVHGTKIWVRFRQDQPPGGPARPEGDGEVAADARTVRAWAAGRGMPVPDRGRLPQRVLDEYEQAAARGEVEI